MVRTAHRSLVARVLAVCLLGLTASPLTAPFTAFDLSDIDHSQPASASHHPGHEMAEAHAKVAPHLLVTAPRVEPEPVSARDDRPALAKPLLVPPGGSSPLGSVLRV